MCHLTLVSDTLSLYGTVVTGKKAGKLLAKGASSRQTRQELALDQVGTNSQKLPQAIVMLKMRED